MKNDVGMDILLEFSGESFYDESGYWWKIKAYKVTASTNIPHGIRYELTLHDKTNRRIMGFDNAHPPKLTSSSKRKGRYRGTIHHWDHWHQHAKDPGIAYEFESAEQLMADFFDQINQIIESAEKQK